MAVLSLWPRLGLDYRRAPHWLWFALLAILLMVKHRIAPAVINEQVTFFNTVIAYEAARFLVFVQVAQLFVRRPGGRLPSWFAALSCLGMVFASNVRLNPSTRPAAMILCGAFVAAMAIFAALHRRRATPRLSRPARTIAGVILLVALGSGVVTANLLRRYESQLERWLIGHRDAEEAGEVAAGFSGRGTLGDIAGWKQHAATHVALRVHAKSAPGYLRGIVFDELVEHTWTESAQVRAIGFSPSQRLAVPRHERLYALQAGASESRVQGTLEVWPDELTGERMFLPLEAAYVSTPPARLTINRNDLATRSGVGGAVPYTAWLDTHSPPFRLDPVDRRRFLKLDDQQRPEFEHIARDIFTDCRTTDEKLAAIVRFFHEHFEYRLQLQLYTQPDVILRFLRERRPAHCEYFASAATLLLRAADVPTRYVTGYVATESHPEGTYWIARRQDAHAWVEAFDDQTGRWRIVECTPPGGVPHSEASDDRTSYWDARWQQVREWVYRASAGGVRGWLMALAAVLLTPPGLVCIVLVAAATLLWKRRYNRLHPRAAADAPPFPALGRTLRRADRLAVHLGLQRSAHETLSQFATRLRADASPRRTAAAAGVWRGCSSRRLAAAGSGPRCGARPGSAPRGRSRPCSGPRRMLRRGRSAVRSRSRPSVRDQSNSTSARARRRGANVM